MRSLWRQVWERTLLAVLSFFSFILIEIAQVLWLVIVREHCMQDFVNHSRASRHRSHAITYKNARHKKTLESNLSHRLIMWKLSLLSSSTRALSNHWRSLILVRNARHSIRTWVSSLLIAARRSHSCIDESLHAVSSRWKSIFFMSINVSLLELTCTAVRSSLAMMTSAWTCLLASVKTNFTKRETRIDCMQFEHEKRVKIKVDKDDC